MSLMDGLKETLRNPLVENEKDFSFAMECDFEAALEEATEKQLTQADIDAILNGDDDIPDEDDPDESDDYEDAMSDPDRTAEPATEGIKALIMRHRAHKLDKAKVTVLADQLTAPGKAEWAVKKFVAAADKLLTKDSTAEAWIRAQYDDYKKEDNASQKTTMKTIGGYLIIYITNNDQLVMVCIPTMTKKGKPSTMTMLPHYMAQVILAPITTDEIADTVANESTEDEIDSLLEALEAMSDPDHTAENDLIAECDAALQNCTADDCTPDDIALDDSTSDDDEDPDQEPDGLDALLSDLVSDSEDDDTEDDDDDDEYDVEDVNLEETSDVATSDDNDSDDDSDESDPFDDDAFESMLSKCVNNL